MSEPSWTVIWVSALAFKPDAAFLREKLQSLGCQLKCYKSHLNAVRALEKKYCVKRTVVLVAGPEAPPLLTYLDARVELSCVPVVVEAEATGRSAFGPEASRCAFADDFDAAVSAVQTASKNLDFQGG